MRTLYYSLQTKHLRDLITHCSCSLSVGVYWPSTTALKRKLSWWIAFTNALKPSSKFCSALFYCRFLLKWEFQWFRWRSVSLDLTERRERPLAPLGPPSREPHSLLEAHLPGARQWRHVSPTDVPRPFLLCWDISLWISLSLSEQAVVSQRRITGRLFFQRLPYANRSIPDH